MTNIEKWLIDNGFKCIIDRDGERCYSSEGTENSIEIGSWNGTPYFCVFMEFDLESAIALEEKLRAIENPWEEAK